MDAYLAASHEVLTLQDQETAAILEGSDMDRFDLALEAARIKRDAAKATCMKHIAEHEC